MTNEILNNMIEICSLYDFSLIDIMILYKHNNKYYILEWYDVDEKRNYYKIYEVFINDLDKYVNKKYPISIIYEKITEYSNIKKENDNNFYELIEDKKPISLSQHLYDTYFNEDECRDYEYVKKYIKNEIRKQKINNLI